MTAKGVSAAAGSRSTGQGDTTEHTKANRRDDEDADDQCQAIGAATEHTRSIGVVSGDDITEPGNGPRSTGDATGHNKDHNGDDEQAHDQSGTMSAATEHDRKPTKQLKQHDDSCQRERATMWP